MAEILGWIGLAAAAGVIGTLAWVLLVQGSKRGVSVAQTFVNVARFTGAFKRNGVRGMFFERADYMRFRKQPTVEEYIGTARDELLYVGYWLAQGFEIGGAHSTIKTMADRGVRFKFVLLSPKAPAAVLSAYARFFDLDRQALVDRITASLQTLHRTRDSLSPTLRDNLQIHTHEQFLSCSAFLFDRRDPKTAKMLIDTKFFMVERERTLGLELVSSRKADGLYERLTRSLGHVEELSIPHS